MGCACSPRIGNLFMEQLEMDFIYNNDQNSFSTNIVQWRHYIDYIFMLFRDASQVLQFVEWLNHIHPSIKFVANINAHEINFLDTTLYRDNSSHLAFKVYRKPIEILSCIMIYIIPDAQYRI